jgi:ABC-type sugar transport system permease subunit
MIDNVQAIAQANVNTIPATMPTTVNVMILSFVFTLNDFND